jgi:hypothetical protein
MDTIEGVECDSKDFDGRFRTMDGDGWALLPNDDPFNFRILEVTPDEHGLFVMDLTKLPSIDGMTITPAEGIVRLVSQNNVLLQTKPREDGTVVFWENWYWVTNSAFDAKIVISNVSVDKLTVKFHKRLDEDFKFVPLYIQDQDFVPKMFEGTPYNNALFFEGGRVILRYTNT